MSAPIWSEEAGAPDDDVVVLIHGSMDRAAGLLKLSRRLDRCFRVVRYDRRGYGRSAPHDGPFGMAGQVEDLLEVLAGRRAVLFGHSYGGNVALAAAARHPESVRAVAVFEAPLSWKPWWPHDSAGATALNGDRAEAGERFMRRLLGDARWERLPERTRASRRREGATMVGELADLREHEPWRGEDIRVPVVAMRGSDGAEHHRLAMEALPAELPAVRLEVVEGSRHFGPNTHPDEVAAIVTSLVGSLPRR